MSSNVLKIVLLFLCLTITHAIFSRKKVDCSVSGWSRWISSRDTGKLTRIRRVMRYPQNGGKSCPHLNETKATATATCKVTKWSKWSDNFGFGQQSRIRSALPSIRGRKRCSKVGNLEEVRYTGKVPSVGVTAKNVQNYFMRPTGQIKRKPLQRVQRLRLQHNNGPAADMVRDLVLIMDSSGSIKSAPFEDAKFQTSRLIGLLCPNDPTPPFDKIAGSPYQYNQAAMVTFSTSVVENFDFNAYDTTTEIQQAIMGANYEGLLTNTHLAFDMAKSMFDPSKGVRDATQAKREVLILTDGRSTSKTKTLEAVEKLKAEADVYGLMIGNFTLAGMQELTSYVSSPINQHLFYLEDYTELEVLVDMIEAWKLSVGDNWCAPFNP